MAFSRVAAAAEIAPGQVREARLGGETIAVANVDGHFYAISNTCLHRGGPLGQGVLDGQVLTCPWHGWSFDVTNGRLSHNQAGGVACYRVEVRGADLFVESNEAPSAP
jgi:nitrite reductase (NADH) small subunit